jgi:hypothetical protein
MQAVLQDQELLEKMEPELRAVRMSTLRRTFPGLVDAFERKWGPMVLFLCGCRVTACKQMCGRGRIGRDWKVVCCRRRLAVAYDCRIWAVGEGML